MKISSALPVRPTPREVDAGLREFLPEDVNLWHFAMMNDSARNAAYEKALEAAIKGGETVLDIGTGSGLLAMMAIRHGAKEVIACEVHPRIAQKGREIIRHNGYENKIRVINKKSTDLIVGQDIPERLDLMVTEIFDDGLLGECALPTIQHAKEHLLKPHAQILPAGATVHLIALESQEIYENGQVNKIAGFDLQAFNEFMCDDYVGYHLDKMNYRSLCAPQTVFNFNFNDVPGRQSKWIEIPIITSGICHSFAYWFDLHLDGHTSVSTAPGQTILSGWKQAVQLLPSPKKLTKGETLRIYARQELESLSFTLEKG